MIDVFPSAPLLVHNQRFISFAMLCRSTLDIVIQLTWIISLDNAKKEKAIKCFTEFQGLYLSENDNPRYDWQSLVDKKYNLRSASIAVGIDKEILNFPVNKVYRKSIENGLVINVNGVELKLTVYDYLSKITHWNPRLLAEMVGVNSDKHLGYTSEYLRMCIITLPTFISCAVIFSEIFCRHFFEDEDNHLEKLKKIKAYFEKSFADLLNDSLIDSAMAG